MGKVESSFGLCFELLASMFVTSPPRVMLSFAKSCKLVTEQIIVWGLGEVGRHLSSSLAYILIPPLWTLLPGHGPSVSQEGGFCLFFSMDARNQKLSLVC